MSVNLNFNTSQSAPGNSAQTNSSRNKRSQDSFRESSFGAAPPWASFTPSLSMPTGDSVLLRQISSLSPSSTDASSLAPSIDVQGGMQQLASNYLSYGPINSSLFNWPPSHEFQQNLQQALPTPGYPGASAYPTGFVQSNTGNSDDSYSNNPALTMQEADKAYEHSHFHHAIGLYAKVIAQDPANASAYNRRGLAKAAIRDNAGAIADYTLAIAVAPRFYNAYLNRGNLWMYAKDYDKALTDYGKAIEISPQNRAAYENRSELYISMGRRDLSLADRATVIRLEEARMETMRPAPAAYSRRVALVLANDDYPGENNDLHGGPINDAGKVSAQLQNSGFQVISGFNLTGPQTEAKVGELVAYLRQNPGAVSLIYYSGHGGAINGNNYLIPIEYRGDNADEVLKNAVSVDYLLQQLKTAPSAFNMIFLDACRTRLENGLPGDNQQADFSAELSQRASSNASPSARFAAQGSSSSSSAESKAFKPSQGSTVADWAFNGSGSDPPKGVSKRWEVEPAPPVLPANTWIEFASRPDTVAVQSNGQGLYTKYLLQYMSQPGLNLEEVSMYTNYALERDPDAIEQNQHARTQTDLSHTEALAESFYFKPIRPAVVPSAQTNSQMPSPSIAYSPLSFQSPPAAPVFAPANSQNPVSSAAYPSPSSQVSSASGANPLPNSQAPSVPKSYPLSKPQLVAPSPLSQMPNAQSPYFS